jgi:hypothetical protein
LERPFVGSRDIQKSLRIQHPGNVSACIAIAEIIKLLKLNKSSLEKIEKI